MKFLKKKTKAKNKTTAQKPWEIPGDFRKSLEATKESQHQYEMLPIQSEFSPEHPRRFYAQRSDRDTFGEMKLQGDKINLESILEKLDNYCWKDTLTIHLLI